MGLDFYYSTNPISVEEFTKVIIGWDVEEAKGDAMLGNEFLALNRPFILTIRFMFFSWTTIGSSLLCAIIPRESNGDWNGLEEECLRQFTVVVVIERLSMLGKRNQLEEGLENTWRLEDTLDKVHKLLMVEKSA